MRRQIPLGGARRIMPAHGADLIEIYTGPIYQEFLFVGAGVDDLKIQVVANGSTLITSTFGHLVRDENRHDGTPFLHAIKLKVDDLNSSRMVGLRIDVWNSTCEAIEFDLLSSQLVAVP